MLRLALSPAWSPVGGMFLLWGVIVLEMVVFIKMEN